MKKKINEENLYGKKVLENSCGDGNILLKIVMRYIKSAKRQERTSCEIKDGLQRDIVAYEIDDGCIETCKKRLDEVVDSYGIQNVSWNLNNKDFLKELVEKKRLLKEKMQTLSADEMQDYIKMDALLEKLEKNMFERKE